MIRRIAPLALLLSSALPLSLAAQERLAVGQITQGSLTQLDPVTGEGQHYDDWRVALRARHRYRVVMRSSAFDAYLVVGRSSAGTFTQIASDDDGGGGTDASLTFVAGNDGDFIVRARALSASGEGGYSLAVTDEGEVQPLRAQAITPGQAVSGALDAKDPTTDDGKPVDYYRFSTRAGRRYAVTLLSDNFDAYLELGSGANGVFTRERSNDDGGGGTNAKIRWVAREGGEVWILVRSFNADAGAYTLLLEDLGQAPPPAATVALSHGRTVEGRIDEGDEEGEEGPFDLYSYEGRAGEVIVIRMDSDAFDPYLAIGRETDGEWRELDKDDDGGLGTNAHLEYRLPEDGRYLIRARPLGRDGRGAYLLRME